MQTPPQQKTYTLPVSHLYHTYSTHTQLLVRRWMSDGSFRRQCPDAIFFVGFTSFRCRIYIYIYRSIDWLAIDSVSFFFSFFRKSAIEWESASTVGFILLFQFASRFLKNYNFVSATRSAKKSRMCFSYSTLYIHSCTSILEEFFFEREIWFSASVCAIDFPSRVSL